MLAISARSLSKRYGSLTAVDGIDIAVESGQIFGFLGPNGAGKSTTIKMLTTLIPPTSGSLEVLGIDALSSPLEIRKRIGVILQQPSYEPPLSVERSIETYAMMWDVPRRERKERTRRILDEFDLLDIRKRKMDDLSIGQRRRAQVAREFVHDTDLLFLDEPTVGMDPAARRSLLDSLKRRAQDGLTIFFTTHVLTEAEYTCDKTAIINRGRVFAVSTPEELKRKFGRKKTITARLPIREGSVLKLLAGVEGCRVDLAASTEITINSVDPEETLLRILDILGRHNVAIENLAVSPVSLEDIFLDIVGGNGAPGS